VDFWDGFILLLKLLHGPELAVAAEGAAFKFPVAFLCPDATKLIGSQRISLLPERENGRDWPVNAMMQELTGNWLLRR